MPKELTSLIEEIRSGKINETGEVTIAREFLSRFKKGIEEEPEKIGELMGAFYGYIKKTRPYLNFHSVWNAALRNLTVYCFLADNAYYEVNFEDMSLGAPFTEHLLKPKNYGTATKALSNYLGCGGRALVIRIFERDRLN